MFIRQEERREDHCRVTILVVLVEAQTRSICWKAGSAIPIP